MCVCVCVCVCMSVRHAQVGLYAEYQPDALLNFLRNSNCYLLEDALRVCEAKQMYAEMVCLLRKMGDLPAALALLIDRIRDVKQVAQSGERIEKGGQLSAPSQEMNVVS